MTVFVLGGRRDSVKVSEVKPRWWSETVRPDCLVSTRLAVTCLPCLPSAHNLIIVLSPASQIAHQNWIIMILFYQDEPLWNRLLVRLTSRAKIIRNVKLVSVPSPGWDRKRIKKRFPPLGSLAGRIIKKWCEITPPVLPDSKESLSLSSTDLVRQ